MKGAVNVISIVLISGIIISLVGATYLWSYPLLDKGRTNTVFQTASNFVLELNNEIIDIANSGGGESSIEIPIGMILVVPDGYNDPLNNSILLDIVLSQPLALNSSKTYLGDASFVDITGVEKGTFGESPPSTVSFSLSPLGTSYKGTFQIHFRELVTRSIPIQGFKISLNKDKGIVSGGRRLDIAYIDQEISGETTITNIEITVS